MSKDLGALSGSREPSPSSTGLGPAGFDPERSDVGCPYELTDPRAMVWCDGYQAALRWMKELTR